MSKVTEGAVISLIGLGAMWGSFQIPPPLGNEIWAGLVPVLVASSLVLCGAVLLVGAVREKAVASARSSGQASMNLSVLVVIALAFIYQYAIGAFGYLLPTAVVAPVILYIFGVRSIVGLAVSVVLCPLIFHILFFELLGVFPPYGTVFEPLDLIRG